MLKFLNKKLLSPKESLHKKAAFYALSADIVAIWYVKVFWIDLKMDKMLKLSLSMQGLRVSQIPESTYAQLKHVSISSIQTLLFLFLLWHTIIYICLFFKKKWSIGYVYRYAVGTIILSTIEVVSLLTSFSNWTIPALGMCSIYILTFLALKRIKE